MDYLQAHNVVTLATSGSQGIWAAAVFYASNELQLYFLSSPNSRHCLNLTTNPRIAATIQEDYKSWPEIKGIQLEGVAIKLEGEERDTAILHYGKKYPIVANLDKAPPAIATAFNKVSWYKIVPDALHFIDNEQGFGHRESLLTKD